MTEIMRGYFGIGVEGISKPFNVGNVMRTAHAFGACFMFTIGSQYKHAASDTAKTHESVPFFAFDEPSQMILPKDCSLVGIELMDDAIDLPIFAHPLNAAYVLGPERGALSAELTDRCDYIIKIPTRFSINLGVAGAIVLYDRLRMFGRFGDRPINPRVAPQRRRPHIYGKPRDRLFKNNAK